MDFIPWSQQDVSDIVPYLAAAAILLIVLYGSARFLMALYLRHEFEMPIRRLAKQLAEIPKKFEREYGNNPSMHADYDLVIKAQQKPLAQEINRLEAKRERQLLKIRRYFTLK